MTGNKDITLESSPRGTGTGISKNLRHKKEIPCVIYGPTIKENLNIKITEKNAAKYMKSEFLNSIFLLKSEDKKVDGLRVLIKSTTSDIVKGRPVHIDFYVPNMKVAVKVEVDINFTGESIGVKDGGVINTVRNQLEVECLPTNIPDSIEVDVSAIEIGGSIHVSDITVKGDYKIVTPSELTIMTVAQIQEEKEPEVETAPIAEGDAADAPAPEAAAEETKTEK